MGHIWLPPKGKEHIRSTFDRDIRNLEAYHESRHTENVPDDIAIAMFSEDFLQDMERNGSRRRIMADLGFDFEEEAGEVEHIPVDLSKGYCTFDQTLVKDEDGLDRPVGYKVVKGKGKAHIFMQGDKHGVS